MPLSIEDRLFSAATVFKTKDRESTLWALRLLDPFERFDVLQVFMNEPDLGRHPIDIIRLWYAWKYQMERKEWASFWEKKFTAVLEQHLSWYKNADPLEEGLPVLHQTPHSLLPDAHYWHLASVSPKGVYQLQEPLHISLVVWANECLLQIGTHYGMPLKNVSELNELTVYSMNEKLWDEEYGIYLPCDVHTGDTLLSGSIGGILPLMAEVPSHEQAEQMRATFEMNFIKEGYYLTATNSLFDSSLDVAHAGRGALQPEINWLLYLGFLRFNFDDLAIRLRASTMELIGEFGFYSAYESHKKALGNRGLEKGNVAATASILADFCKTNYMHPLGEGF